MAIRKILFILAGASLFSLQAVRVSAQGPPINTDSPILLGLNGGAVRSFARVIRMSGLNDKKMTVYVSPIVLPYNLTTELLIGGVLPLVNKKRSSISGSSSSTGIGDVKLYAKYVPLQIDRDVETIRLAVKGTVKFPTGDEGKDPALGTGSTDFTLSSVVGWIKPRVGFYLEGLYSINTSRDSLNYGDSFGYNFALGYRLLPAVYKTYPSPQLTAYLELNGVATQKNKLKGSDLENSGGTTIFLSPGLQYIGGRRWLAEASFQYPIVDEPNGTQLGTDFTLSLGVRILVI
ncbi:hypothetical protein IIA15_03800 [candidate division TA06 bacterium]|nr:hypothetical protein [candidate division TA06 bacterium]